MIHVLVKMWLKASPMRIDWFFTSEDVTSDVIAKVCLKGADDFNSK